MTVEADADDDWDDEDFQATARDPAEGADIGPDFQHSEKSVGASVSEPAATLPSAAVIQETGVEMDFEAELQDSSAAAPAMENGLGEAVEAMADPWEASIEPEFDPFESAGPATESEPADAMAAARGPQEGSFDADFEDSTPAVAVTEGDAKEQSLPATAALETADLEADNFDSNAADPAADCQPLEIEPGIEQPQETSYEPEVEHNEPAAAAASEPADASPAVAEPQETSFEADFDANFEVDFQSAPAPEPADSAGMASRSQVEDSTAFEADFVSATGTAAASEPAHQTGPQPTIGEAAVAEGGQLTANSLSSEVPAIGAQELVTNSLQGTYHTNTAPVVHSLCESI